MWIAPKRRVVNCFQIRNFEISNNIPRAFLGGVPVVNCFQIHNFVISNNGTAIHRTTTCVVNCFQIRNFVISNNVEMQNAIEKEL